MPDKPITHRILPPSKEDSGPFVAMAPKGTIVLVGESPECVVINVAESVDSLHIVVESEAKQLRICVGSGRQPLEVHIDRWADVHGQHLDLAGVVKSAAAEIVPRIRDLHVTHGNRTEEADDSRAVLTRSSSEASETKESLVRELTIDGGVSLNAGGVGTVELLSVNNARVNSASSQLAHCSADAALQSGMFGKLLVEEGTTFLIHSHAHQVWVVSGARIIVAESELLNVDIHGAGKLVWSRSDELEAMREAASVGEDLSICCLDLARKCSIKRLLASAAIKSVGETTEGGIAISGATQHLCFSLSRDQAEKMRNGLLGIPTVFFLPEATAHECEFQNVRVAIAKRAVVSRCIGTIDIHLCREAMISGQDKLLRITSWRPSADGTGDGRFQGAIINDVKIPADLEAIPLLQQLREVASANPVPVQVSRHSLPRDVNPDCVELLNSIVAEKSTRGSVKTAMAYAAGVCRMHSTTNRHERMALRCLSVFGFANRPGVAFHWWLRTILTWVAIMFAGDYLMERPFRASDCIDRPLSLVVEPLNLFKAKQLDAKVYPAFWPPYVVVFMRATLALALGHFLVAFSRYTRVAIRY